MASLKTNVILFRQNLGDAVALVLNNILLKLTLYTFQNKPSPHRKRLFY